MKEPDHGQVAAFLEAIANRNGWHTPFTWQVLPDHAGVTALPHHFTASLYDAFERLVRENEKGGGIFVTVQETDGKGRAVENIVAGRSLFIDWDRPDFRLQFALPPTVTLWTARGMHAYWRVFDLDVADVAPALKHLARFYDSDPNICDAARVMRVPGFYHQKGDPIMVRLAHVDRHVTYSLDELLAAHPVLPEEVASVRTLPIDDDGDTELKKFRAWAQFRPIDEGARNKNAFVIGADGFRRGLTEEQVASVVREYCERAGIPEEAASIIKSARKRR